MRDWRGWLKEARQELSEALKSENAPIQLRLRECNQLFEIELLITLFIQVYNNSPSANLRDAWSLLTGYVSAEIEERTELIHKIAIARHRVRYLRTQTAWHKALEWYEKLPSTLCLYEIDATAGTYARRSVLHYVPQRIEAIEQAIDTVAEHELAQERWAKADQEYNFYLGVDIASVRIPSILLEGMAAVQKQQEAMPLLLQRQPWQEPPPPLTIRMSDLEQAAIALNQKLPHRNWVNDFQRLQLHLIEKNGLNRADSFNINGLFHLLGPTGAGKSTLIYLLVYHLCSTNPNFRIGIIANTVVDALDLAADCVRMGINAAPILGRQRGDHRYQYGMAKADDLSPEVLMQPYSPETEQLLDNPVLPWLTGTCILSGLIGEGGIPAGDEPCYDLFTPEAIRRREEDRRRQVSKSTCPFLPSCPVHQSTRDLVSAQVWVATPASFLFTYAPTELTNDRVRALEAIYRYCNLLIVDEVDRVQVALEDAYAPANDLSGHQRAILDQIHITIAQRDFKQNYSGLADHRYRELRNVADEAERLASWLRTLLIDYAHLRDWAKHPLYNSLIYNELIAYIHKLAPSDVEPNVLNEALQQLESEFVAYYRFAPDEVRRQQVSALEDIVSDVRSQQRNNVFTALRKWLQERIPYTLDAYSPEHQRLIERLAFGVILSAMDRYVNDLLRYWLAVSPELSEGLPLSQSPPDEYIDLGIESPLGNLLGYQFFATNEEATRGVLRYIHCLGLGRYLLLRFPYLYQAITGEYGPHTLLTSATSWAPGSPQFNVGIPPHAILVPPTGNEDTVSRSNFSFLSVPDIKGEKVRVSGRSGEQRFESLIQLVRYLGLGSGATDSFMEKELAYWQGQGRKRGILLLTGSYLEAEVAASVLQDTNQWRNRVDCLQSDRAPEGEEWFLRRGQTERFPQRGKEVLVAPLPSIQRGYNILDPETNTAFLGSVFFLVRPFPNPTDVGRHIRAINRWSFEEVMNGTSILPPTLGEIAPEAVKALRSKAYRQWSSRLQSASMGAEGMQREFWMELLWDQVVALVQVLGRATRGNVPLRVYFCDAAFYPDSNSRSLLLGWKEILDDYLSSGSQRPLVEQQLAKILYGSVHDRLSDLITRL